MPETVFIDESRIVDIIVERLKEAVGDGKKGDHSLSNCPLITKYIHGKLDTITQKNVFGRKTTVELEKTASLKDDLQEAVAQRSIAIVLAANNWLALKRRSGALKKSQVNEYVFAAAMYALMHAPSNPGKQELWISRHFNPYCHCMALDYKVIKEQLKAGKKDNLQYSGWLARRKYAICEMAGKKFAAEEVGAFDRVNANVAAAIVMKVTKPPVNEALRHEQIKINNEEYRKKFAVACHDSNKHSKHSDWYLKTKKQEPPKKEKGIIASIKRGFTKGGKGVAIFMVMGVLTGSFAMLLVKLLPIAGALAVGFLCTCALITVAAVAFVLIKRRFVSQTGKDLKSDISLANDIEQAKKIAHDIDQQNLDNAKKAQELKQQKLAQQQNKQDHVSVGERDMNNDRPANVPHNAAAPTTVQSDGMPPISTIKNPSSSPQSLEQPIRTPDNLSVKNTPSWQGRVSNTLDHNSKSVK